MFQAKLVSSLYKIFSDIPCVDVPECKGISALHGETVAFQVVLNSDKSEWVDVKIESDLKDVSVREVCDVPGTHPWGDDSDFLRHTSEKRLYPDPLMPCTGRTIAPRTCWRALWISVPIPGKCRTGKHEIRVRLTRSDVYPYLKNEEPQKKTLVFTLDVKKSVLPELSIFHTEWFHSDCIAKYYGVEAWSEEHWALLEKYFRNAVSLGINTVLTPVWTQPLDTCVGGERPTVQLVGVVKKGKKYTFDFTNLRRWIELALKCGYRNLEFAHPFTQWGAEYTPKVMAEVDGKMQRIFGWDVPSSSKEYASFLNQLIPQLLEIVKEYKLEKNVFFHVSDEPSPEHLDSYKRGFRQIKKLIGDIPVIDALSSVEFYKKGVSEIPVPSISHVEDFIAEKVDPLFTYYCCGPWENTINRYMAMPSGRVRMLGTLLYLYDLDGFLHWGYNFWFSQYSICQNLNPFVTTDAMGEWPSGDAFLVYPGKDGPIDSIRGRMIAEAFQDFRALKLLESKIGRAKTVKLIHEGLDYKITWTSFPKEREWLAQMRRKVNDLL